MAKKRGKRKGKSKKDRKSKAKRRKFISRISRDGKISKKEGRKAAKKKISLRKIKNRRAGDYRQAKRDYERSGRAGSYKAPSGRPQFEPLKIKRGAERADFKRQMEDYDRRARPKGRSNKPSRSSSSDNRPTSSYADRAASELSMYDDQLESIMEGDYQDPLTFQYAASSLVEPGNNLTIGAATDPSKITGTGKFKRRRKRKKNRLLAQIGGSGLGNFQGTPTPTSSPNPLGASTGLNV